MTYNVFSGTLKPTQSVNSVVFWTSLDLSSGSAFHAAEPACENARSPNFLRNRGQVFFIMDGRGVQCTVRTVSFTQIVGLY